MGQCPVFVPRDVPVLQSGEEECSCSEFALRIPTVSSLVCNVSNASLSFSGFLIQPPASENGPFLRVKAPFNIPQFDMSSVQNL
jgi:hypothetical protein